MTALRSILLLSVAASGLAVPAHAQAVDADPAIAEDIIVTARRRDERLQDVPASVTVLTQETLVRTGIERAEGFLLLTPGVTIVTGTAEAGDTQINIRGINGARDAESSVALVVDGILKTNVALLNQPIEGMRQIEVLKGPQGAYYGRNAAAGAIVIQTVKPGDELEGQARISYGGRDTIEAAAYVATPVTENLGVAVAGFYRSTDGFWTNDFLQSKTVDDQENWAIDVRAVAQLSENTELDVKGRYGQLSGASIAFNAAFHLPNFAAANPAFYEDVNAHNFRFYSNIRPTNDQETLEFSAKLDHDFGDVKLVGWALYSNVKQNLVADGTSADFARYISTVSPAGQPAVNACFASTAALTGFPMNPPTFIGQIPVPFIFAPANGSTFGPYSPTTCDGTQYQKRDQEDVSVELRLVSDTDGAFDWQAGFYYLNIDRTVAINLAADTGAGVIKEIYNPPSSSNPTSQLLADNFRTNVYAFFGAVGYEFSPQFAVNAALRYDIEQRRAIPLVPTATDPFTGGPINPGQAFGPLQEQEETWSQPQPKVSLSWRPNSNLNIYANWGIGFKSGGFNNQGSAAIVDVNFNQFIGADVLITDQFDKETSNAVEGGIKGTLLDGRVSFDLAGYYTRVTDMQFFEFFVGGFGLLRVVSNIDKVRIAGAEVNVSARIVDGWTIYSSFNVTDSEILENSSRPYTVGNEAPYTADYTFNIGSQMEAPINDRAKAVLRVDYRLTGPTWFHTVQDQVRPTLFSGLLPGSALGLPSFVGDARYDVAQRDAFGILSLRVGFETERFAITGFAENMMDEEFLAEVIPAIEFGGSFISPGARRLFGVEGRVKF